MPKKRFTDEKLAFALRRVEAGTNVGEVCRKMGVAEVTSVNVVEKAGWPEGMIRRLPLEC
jgi:putative transposase